MCGILFQINKKKISVNKKNFYEMTDCLSHRGPDSEGVYFYRNLGFGHKRLSIIDLSSRANQPMKSKNGRYSLIYNGEIYNFQKIKSQLIKLGHLFKTNSDTEVVLNALIQWGSKAILKFNGMFCFCFYDKKNNNVLVARDRYGIKPLYVYEDEGVIIYSSENKVFTKYNKYKKKINYHAVSEYFTFQNFITNNTPLENIKLFEPATIHEIEVENLVVKKSKYWDYKFSIDKDRPKNFTEAVEELDSLIDKSIDSHLTSDVEIGTFLSGGIDSSLISNLIGNKINNLKTFTCGFDVDSSSNFEFGYDERKQAELISSLLNTEHYQIVLKAGDLERCMNDFSYYLEEPRIGQSYPNYYVSKLASKFVKVAMSGTGGDELFAGYPWRYFAASESQNFDQYIKKYFQFWQRLLTERDKKKLFLNQDLRKIDEEYNFNLFANLIKKHDVDLEDKNQFINHSLYFELKTFLHSLFIVEDKLSMANSLEIRVPFMDNDIVDFALKCPIEFKLAKNFNSKSMNENRLGPKKNYIKNKSNQGKKILREVCSLYLPEEIYGGIKKGFSAPDSGWFKNKSYNFIENTILNKNAKIFDFFEKKEIKNILDSHKQGKENHRLLIWSFLSFEYYLNQYVY